MTTNSPNTPGQPSRRQFIQTSGAVTLGAAVAAMQRGGVHAASTDTLRVGLVGCGGRGSGAAYDALCANPNNKLVALGDVFADRVEESLGKFKEGKVAAQVAVDDDHRFVGFDAYKGVIDSCDVIVLATPPAFRPEHLRACVEAGKHVFCEKPIAVDGPGVRSVIETCEMARAKRLNIVSGLCYRYENVKRDIIKRIHDGAVGDIKTIQTTYNTGALWHMGRQPEWSEMEYQLRNWLYFDWLSGDHINEQHIHSLDKVAWAMQNVYPAKAVSSGGRVQRIDPKYGNVYDHFNTVYEWENGVKCFSSCRQWESSSTDVSDHVWGTTGIAHIQTHEIEGYDGQVYKAKRADGDNMYQNEHDALFAAIRNGDVIVDEYMCYSTLMAIMGRMAAYTGKAITWDQALNSQWDLTPGPMEWGDVPVNPVARPGFTEFS